MVPLVRPSFVHYSTIGRDVRGTTGVVSQVKLAQVVVELSQLMQVTLGEWNIYVRVDCALPWFCVTRR